ncbi:hypothetical protein [Maribacter stanieri]|nr:hypothetical protein [Maribacter stanieri]
MQFVIRLRDDIRSQLNSKVEITPEKLQAFSTYLHENIHWWQHIGSNFGFLLSTSYPANAISSFGHLKKLVEKEIKYKSLLKYDEEYYKKNGKSDIPELNILTNNFYDLEYAKLFSLDNKNIHQIIKDKRFFLNVGHSYMILWTNSIFIYSQTLDQDFDFLPKMNDWIPNFEKLKQEKVNGFHTESDYAISSLGIKAIYEGQAIFNQILYLKNVFKENKIIFKDFIENGMLYGIYIEAFDIFLKILEEERPFFLEDPLIGLFLLVCDISINPNNGFPLDIYDYKNFINKNDPGIRFIGIAKAINKNKDYYLTKCTDLSKQTYIDLSKLLNKKIGCKCSYSSIKDVLNWKENESIIKLLEEESNYLYENVNMPFRLFFSKYLRFQEDKYENPHYFCWIGHHIPNAKSNEVIQLFEKHKALFIDSEDGEIKPVIQKNVDKETLYKTFNNFYQHTILYELILKWISEDGDFKLDYKWLFNKRNDENAPIIRETFKYHFGVDIDEIKSIKNTPF